MTTDQVSSEDPSDFHEPRETRDDRVNGTVEAGNFIPPSEGRATGEGGEHHS